jgi:hypothetical protein
MLLFYKGSARFYIFASFFAKVLFTNSITVTREIGAPLVFMSDGQGVGALRPPCAYI